MRNAHEQLDAIAREAAAASSGIGPEVVTTLRRRRVRRRVGQGAGIAVLAVGAVAVAGPLVSWLSPTVVPPAEQPTVTEPGPTPTDVDPTESPAVVPTGMACGASEDWLIEMADPVTHPVPIGVTAPSLTPTSVDRVPDLVAGISPTGIGDAGSVEVGGVVAVATRDGVVVGGRAFEVPGGSGTEGTVSLDGPLVACPEPGAVAGTGSELLPPGDYGVRVVVTAREPGAAEDFLAIGGPWALTLLPAGTITDAEADQNAVDAAVASLFVCGEPGPDSIHTLPTGPLALAADLPGLGVLGMTGALGTTGGDAVTAVLASADVSGALLAADGRVVGFVHGASGPTEVSLARDATFPLRGEQSLLVCGPDGVATGAAGEDGLPAGELTVWPYLPVLVGSVTDAAGATVDQDAGWQLVVANPQPVTR